MTTRLPLQIVSLAVLSAGVLFGSSISVHAATDSATVSNSSTASLPMVPACISFEHDLYYRMTDTGTSQQISLIQQFLSTNGYFASANLGTGVFGPLTRSAVKKFQADHGVPATGYVGPLTRAAIRSSQGSACDSSVSTTTLYSLSPSKVTVGDTVSVTGFGFSNANTILLDGMVVARDVAISSTRALACTTNSDCHPGINQTLTFSMPSSASPNCAPNMMCAMYMRLLTSGTYELSVMSSSTAKASNTLPITLTGTDPILYTTNTTK